MKDTFLFDMRKSVPEEYEITLTYALPSAQRSGVGELRLK